MAPQEDPRLQPLRVLAGLIDCKLRERPQHVNLREEDVALIQVVA